MKPNDPITIIGDLKTSNPSKGIAPSPIEGIAHIRGLDVTTNPGTARLNWNSNKQSASVVNGMPVWQKKDPVNNFLAGNIWALDDIYNLYFSFDNGSTWNLILGNGAGMGQGLEIWKNYLFVIGTYIDILGPLGGTVGTGTVSDSGTALTGVGTDFGTTGVQAGDVIYIGTAGSLQYRKVNSITNTTSLTLSSAFTGTISGATYGFMHWTVHWTSSPDITPVAGLGETFRPTLKSIDGKLYYGNGKYVHSVTENAAPFVPATAGSYITVAKAITLADNYEIRAIRDLGQYLMLGTIYAQSNLIADIFPYDRSSLTLGIPIRIAEAGVRAMITDGNRLYVMAGVTGKIFVTDTVSAQQIVQIPNYVCNLDGSKQFFIYPDGMMYQKGKLFFGLSTPGTTGAIGSCGVWSYNLTTKALQLENIISTGNDGTTQALSVSSLLANGPDYYLIGWKDNVTYGIDKIDTTLRVPSGYIESQFIKVGQALANRTIGQIEITVQKPLTTGTGVKVYYRKDLNSSWTLIATMDYATFQGTMSQNFSAASITNAVMLQIRAELDSATSISPELQSVLLIPD